MSLIASWALPKHFRQSSRRLLKTEEGATLVEYALLIGLLSLAAFVALVSMAGSINELFLTASSVVGEVAKSTGD